MGEVMLHKIVVIAKVDVEDAAIHTWRIGEIAFVVCHPAVAASPLPDSIGGSDRLSLLHPGIPRNVMFDNAVRDSREQNAVPCHVVDHGISDLDMLAAQLAVARVTA